MILWRSKIFFNNAINRSIRTYRCVPGEGLYLNTSCPVPDEYKNPDNDLYSIVERKDEIIDAFLSSHLSGQVSIDAQFPNMLTPRKRLRSLETDELDLLNFIPEAQCSTSNSNSKEIKKEC